MTTTLPRLLRRNALTMAERPAIREKSRGTEQGGLEHVTAIHNGPVYHHGGCTAQYSFGCDNVSIMRLKRTSRGYPN